ncbi:MAG TPA: hypothetical protein VGE00_03840 [Gammaproteobacteria bacterium]
MAIQLHDEAGLAIIAERDDVLQKSTQLEAWSSWHELPSLRYSSAVY